MTGRAPNAIRKIVDDAVAVLAQTEDQRVQLAIVQVNAKKLARFGDAAVEARDRLSDYALDLGLDPDDVQQRLAKGVDEAKAEADQAGSVVKLHPYQVDVVAKYHQAVEEGRRRIILVSPTGS